MGRILKFLFVPFNIRALRGTIFDRSRGLNSDFAFYFLFYFISNPLRVEYF